MEDVAVADESDLKENLDAMKNFKERYPDIQMHMMLVPNAANVMEDKLPAFAVTASQSRQISRVKAELGDSYDWIDAEKVLDAHKDEAIYYHTDHHWTSLGAWYAFQGAKTQLGLDKSEEIKMKAYAVSDSFNGTLSAKSGYETDYKEPIYIYLPRVRMHHRLQSIMWKNRKRVLLCMIHPNWMREINIPYSSVEIMQ